MVGEPTRRAAHRPVVRASVGHQWASAAAPAVGLRWARAVVRGAEGDPCGQERPAGRPDRAIADNRDRCAIAGNADRPSRGCGDTSIRSEPEATTEFQCPAFVRRDQIGRRLRQFR